MRGKEQVVFDIKSEKFRYLHREENRIRKKVDIDVLNRRLNSIKKSNIYSNAKMIGFSLFIIIFFAALSINF
jgi:hypothetical protein